METYNLDFDNELYQEVLQRQFLKNIRSSHRSIRSVSSLDVEQLFKSSSSVVCNNNRYICPSRKDSGDFFHCGTQEVNYHKIIIERCNRNRGCMCKAIEVADVQKSVQTKDISEDKPDHQHKYVDSRDTQTVPYHKNVENQTSQLAVVENGKEYEGKSNELVICISDRENCNCQSNHKEDKSKKQKKKRSHGNNTDKEVEEKKKKSKKKKENNLKDCRSKKKCKKEKEKAKLCVPPDFEDMASNTDFPKCKNKKCGCQPYDVEEGLKKGLNIPSENICVQKLSDQSCETTKKSCCFCFKKKNKDGSRVESEKPVQTKSICEDKPNHQQRVCLCAPTEENLPLCCKCGKPSDNSCKTCCKNCTKNMIILPSKQINGDQADTLKTLIKMEAKQNYRQVNIILQELNDQKNEIKKLLELYQTLSRNVSGGRLDREDKVPFDDRIRTRETETCPCEKTTHTVTICAGCGLHFYRDSMLAGPSKSEGKTSTVKFDKYLAEKAYSTPQMETDRGAKKPPKNKSKILPEHLNTEHMTIQPDISKNKSKMEINNTKSKISRQKLKNKTIKTKTRNNIPEVISEETIIPASDTEKDTRNTTDASVLTLYKEKVKTQTKYSDDSLTKSEKPATSETDGEKHEKDGLGECKSRTKAFVEWCKKSLISLKQKKASR